MIPGARPDLILSSGFLAFGRHVGFLRGLEAAGIDFDAVVGTSSGSIVGALYVAGHSPRAIEAMLEEFRRPILKLRLHARPLHGVFSMGSLIAFLRPRLPARIEDLPRPFAVGVMDADGRRLAMNAAARENLERRFGLTEEQAIGRSVWELLPEHETQHRQRIMAQVQTERQPVTWEDDLGGVVSESTVYPICDPDGRVVRVAYVSRDITERRRQEEARERRHQALEQLYRTALELNRPQTVDDLALRIIRGAEQVLSADKVALKRIDPKTGDLVMLACSSAGLSDQTAVPAGGVQRKTSVSTPPTSSRNDSERANRTSQDPQHQPAEHEPADSEPVVTEAQQAELWDSLFLTLPEIDELLDFVKQSARWPVVYPMCRA